MNRLSAAVFVLVALMCAGRAFAGPCIECKDCQGMQSCYQVCKQSCTTTPAISDADCKAYGHHAANSAAQKACSLAMNYCSGPSSQGPSPPTVVQGTSSSTSLVQCANSAFNTCQNRALHSSASPCGTHFASPYKQCIGKQFITFYAGIVNDDCRASADMIKNGIVLPVPPPTTAVKAGNRKLLQGQVIIKNPVTVGPKGATASSIQSVPVPAGAQVIVPGQPAVVPAGGQVVVGPGAPQQVYVSGQVQPVVLPGQPAGVVYPGQPVVVPGQAQVIYPVGH